MTKAAALFEWFNGFLPAYPASNVPKDVTFPYLTYELVLGAWGDEDIGITVNLWYYTESEAAECHGGQDVQGNRQRRSVC